MAQNCMVFNLDYDRRSDLDDSVGYWFAQPTGPASCRVFYSCEVKLRGWVPGPVYNVLTKQALKQATTWVSTEATKEWALIQNGCSPQQRFTRFVSNVRTRRTTSVSSRLASSCRTASSRRGGGQCSL